MCLTIGRVATNTLDMSNAATVRRLSRSTYLVGFKAFALVCWPVADLSGGRAKQNGLPSPLQVSVTVMSPAFTVSTPPAWGNSSTAAG